MALEFRCPDYSLALGQSMILRAEVVGAKEVLGEEDAKLISYRWEVSGGKIILGQRTPQVTIEDLRTSVQQHQLCRCQNQSRRRATRA